MNPFAATDGADAQSLTSVQRLAPQAFRAVKRRAVLAQDYADAAETLPWVKDAGATFRWTGSWLTTFTTAEPKATEQIPIAQRTQLIDLLNRYRMAGQSYAPDPQYVSIDLIIENCAAPDAFAGNVEQAVLALLSPAAEATAPAQRPREPSSRSTGSSSANLWSVASWRRPSSPRPVSSA